MRRRRTSQIEQPVLKEIGSSGHWLLYEPWEIALPGTLLMVPKGFVTDLASVPAVLHWLIDDDGLGCAAPLVHDCLYQDHGELCVEWLEPYRTFTRKEADDLLYTISLQSGAAPWRARAAWMAVRLFAGAAWRV